MNVLDIILIAIMVLFTARGLFRGLLKEAVSLGALVLGILLATKLHYAIEPYLAIHIQDPESVQAASYLVIFLLTVGLVWLLAKLVRDVLKFSLTTWIDHAAGGAFGLLEGALLSSLALLLLNIFMPQAEFLTQSSLAPRFRPMMGVLADYMPDSMRQSLEESGFNPGSAGQTDDAHQVTIPLQNN